MAQRRSVYPEEEESISSVVRDLLADVRELVRGEIRLARLEVKGAMSIISRGAALVAGGLALGYLGVLFLLLALTVALATLIPFGWAAFVVGFVVVIVAAVLLWQGVGSIRRATSDLTLTTTRESLEEDARWLKNRMK